MTDSANNLRSAALYRHTVGSGPDVVLLHGWGMHSGVWEDVVEALLDHHRVAVFDLPGHGYSRASGS
ncbi:MAG: alpha/beta fold hydrolase, partial [Anaerolineae bacterium]